MTIEGAVTSMDWTQIITLAGVNIGLILAMLGTVVGLFIWNRSESRADIRAVNIILNEIKNEMKDFHARLCILEERYLQIMKDK
jgi:hypothetical protein